MIGYYLLRQDKPHLRRPFKLPEFMKYVALVLAAVYFVFWLFGGLWYSKIGNVEIYYWLGWATLLAYLPLYWYRAQVEDKRAARQARRVGQERRRRACVKSWSERLTRIAIRASSNAGSDMRHGAEISA